MKNATAIALTMLTAACAGPATPTPDPSLSPDPSPSGGLYLRAWSSQALPPPGTFDWLPVLTVSDGLAIDGNVAVPAIYPGPLLIVPNARPISDVGERALVEQAHVLGLLDGNGDFAADRAMPGGTLGHIVIEIDGRRYEVTGDPAAEVTCLEGQGPRCVTEPGTASAFAWYWQRLSFLGDWLGAELGPTQRYVPQRVALLTQEGPPADDPQFVTRQPWPLDSPFGEWGEPWPGLPGVRCGVVEGEELDPLLAALSKANELTRWVDEQEAERSLVVRVLVPGEPSPCPAG